MRWCSSRAGIALVARGARLPLVVLFAALAGACNGDDEPTNQDGAPSSVGHECEERGEPIELGMEKPTGGGLYSVVLVEASPVPPLVGENQWTVGVTTSSGEPVIDDLELIDTAVVINVNMTEHNHNIRKRAVMTTPGVFEFPPFPVTMPGYWEFTVSVAPEPDPLAPPPTPPSPENALFGICVPAD